MLPVLCTKNKDREDLRTWKNGDPIGLVFYFFTPERTGIIIKANSDVLKLKACKAESCS